MCCPMAVMWHIADNCRIFWAWQLLFIWTTCGRQRTSIKSFMRTYVTRWRQVRELQFTRRQRCRSWSEASRWVLGSRPPSKLLRFIACDYRSRGAPVLLNNTLTHQRRIIRKVFATRLKVAPRFANKTRLLLWDIHVCDRRAINFRINIQSIETLVL